GPWRAIGFKVNAFFYSFAKLADSPTSSVARQEVLLQGGALATSFQDMALRLRSAQAHTDRQIRGAVDQINTITSRIAELNATSSHAQATGGMSALQDEQLYLARQL